MLRPCDCEHVHHLIYGNFQSCFKLLFIFLLGYRYGYGAERHFQQYFTYIVTISFIGGGSHRQTASHSVVSSTPRP